MLTHNDTSQIVLLQKRINLSQKRQKITNENVKRLRERMTQLTSKPPGTDIDNQISSLKEQLDLINKNAPSHKSIILQVLQLFAMKKYTEADQMMNKLMDRQNTQLMHLQLIQQRQN